jgi:diguanylate cyclase (GGDEF)-like protein/PAS domain S-box-containing protein
VQPLAKEIGVNPDNPYGAFRRDDRRRPTGNQFDHAVVTGDLTADRFEGPTRSRTLFKYDAQCSVEMLFRAAVTRESETNPRQNEAEMSIASSVPEGVSVNITRDASAVIISVGDEITELLGWSPSELLGHPSTEYIHPEDQPSAVAAWFEMLEAPGQARIWRGRYRTSDEAWKWVECVNVNMLEDPEKPVVLTTMRTVATEHVSLQEELRARSQLLSRLSDAMPVGMFQIDTDRTITFANDRLQLILGHAASESIDAQFSIIDDDDLSLLDSALEAVLSDQAVDDVELRFVRSSEDAKYEARVCVLSMRPLTDWTGEVTGAVGCVSDVTAQVELRRQLETRANTDELTSCLSRPRILEVLSAALDRREDTQGGTATIFIDLCGFKAINDQFGHAAGDQVLKVAGARLRSAIRPYDQVGRFGGDEFLVVCPRVDAAPIALEVARRIGATLTEPVNITTEIIDLGASVGVAWSSESIDADTLVAQADQAMYKSKRAGSSTVVLFSSDDQST